MRLDEILELWKKECPLGDNLEEESRNIPKLHSKYITLLANAKLLHQKIDDELNEMVLKKYQWYEGQLSAEEIKDLGWPDDPFDGKIVKSKTKYEMYMQADKDLVKKKQKLAYTKQKIETLEEIVRALNWRHNHIKNIIDNKRFESGY